MADDGAAPAPAQTRPVLRYTLAVFVGSSALAVAAVTWQVQRNRQITTAQVERLASNVAARVQARMQSYEYGLRGARGAAVAAGLDHLRRDDFRRYGLTRDIDREFPGARGFGLIRRVPQADVGTFEAEARRDGAPDFRVHQLAPRDGERFVIQYLEPEADNAPAIGLDIASEANRREAAVRAMRDGNATLTGPITLVQAEGKQHQSFLLLLPIYRTASRPADPAAREAQTLGWSFAPLSTEDVLATLSPDADHYRLLLRDVTDASPGQDTPPFFNSTPNAASPGDLRLAHRVPLSIYGRRWEAEVRPLPAFVAALKLRSPYEIAAESAVVVALLTALARFHGQARARRHLQLADQAERATMVEAAADAFIGVSLDGRITSWNPAAQTLFGYRADEVLGQRVEELLLPPSRHQEAAPLMERIHQGLPVPTYETTRLARDGRELDVAVSMAPMRDAEGRVVGMVKTLRDIGQAKEAERRLVQLAAELERKVAERTAGLESARRDLRNILDALPSMIGYWDRHLRNRFANHAYKAWFGERAQGLDNKTLPELLGPELFERNRPHVEAALRGEPQTFERSIARPDGPGERHSLAHYLPDVVDGQVQGFYVLVHDITELKQSRQQAATALRDNEFLLDTIHRHAIMSVTDGGGRIIDANEAFCQISGYTLDELLGKTHRMVNSGTQGQDFWPQVWRTISSGVAWRGEVCNRAKDGSLYWVDSIIAPYVSVEGRIDRYISIRFDITARKRAVAELRATHERLALATDAAQMGVWELELGPMTLTWDERMFQLYGEPPSAGPYRYEQWAAHVHPDDLQATEQALRDAISDKRDFQLDFRIQRPDAEIRHIAAAAKVERDTAGQALRLTGVNWDITRRKLAELELAQTTSLLRTVLASASEVSIIATDPDFTIRIFNHGAEKLLGYSSAEVVGQATPALIHNADEIRSRARELSAELGRTVRGGDYFREPQTHGVPREWLYRRKDGSTVPVSLIVTAMQSDDGRLLGFLGIARDIAPEKRHEQALLEAKALAEQANKAKSQFLANMSHEIRTPMNAVLGLSYLLEQTQLDAYQDELLRKMARSSKNLLGVINDVLDLSKIEAGELGISLQPFVPAELIQDLVDVMRVQANGKGIELLLEAPTPLPALVIGDSLRVNQILTNLLGNAIKFTETGYVRLNVQPLEAPEGESRLRFEVHDTGTGIPADALARLFQPFSQADGSITRRFGGTGLGLSIVKQLTEMMAGCVGVSSQPGVGSCFWVELPFRCADPAQLTPPAAPQPPPGTSQHSLKGLHILVVDDSEINLEVAKRILESVGARVTLAVNGQEAVDHLRLQREACDFVLMDIHMPVMDGLSAARLIREELGLHDLPIVALTAGALASQRSEARQAGMNDFITKPFAPAEVIHCIARLAGKASPDALPAAAAPQPPPAHWPSIHGIDAAEVAERLCGDVGLFRTLLGFLLRDFDALPAPDQANLESLAARLHKLRGSAGNVGATALHATATRAEQACLHGDIAAASAEIEALNQQLAALNTAAAPWLETAPTPAPQAQQPLEADQVQALLQLLRKQHVGALDHFEAMASSLRGALGPARFEELRENIQQLRFAEATALLSGLT